MGIRAKHLEPFGEGDGAGLLARDGESRKVFREPSGPFMPPVRTWLM